MTRATLYYSTGKDDGRSLRSLTFGRRWAVVESVLRWLATVAVIAAKWEWLSLSNAPSVLLALCAFFAISLWGIVLLFALAHSASTNAAPAYRWPRRALAIVLCIAVSVSAMLTQWPFYVAFTLSRPFLNRLADRAASGQNMSGWHWAGVWIITDVHVEPDGSVGLYFDRTASGWTGVVRYASPSSTPVGSNNGRRALPSRWELVDED